MPVFSKYSRKFKPERVSTRGYAVLRHLMTPEGVIACKQALTSLWASCGTEWISRNSRPFSDDFIVVRSIDTPSDFFFELARTPVLFRIAEEFAGKRVTPLYVEYFNKPPGCRHPTPPHQDHVFYQSHFTDELGVTFWIALDDCDIQNGCMHLKPVADRTVFQHKASKRQGFAYEMLETDTSGFDPVPLNAGDAIVHGAFTPHYCPPNATRTHRRAIAISFRTSEFRQQVW